MKADVEQDSATVGYFDRQSSGWTGRYNRDGYFRERLETVMEWLKHAPPGLRLLDYGCGSGVLLAALAQAGYLVTGVDLSPGMLAFSRRTLEAAGVSAGRFTLEQVNDDLMGEYLNQTYDDIVSLGVLEYVDRPFDLIELLADCLKPRGRLILSFPNRSSVLRKIERFVFKYPFLFRPLGIFSHLTAPDSYLNFQKHQFTIQEIDQFLAARGLLRTRVHRCVAPGALRRWSAQPAVGMTIIAEFGCPGP
jgi:SAM-dependent methyltransferase